MHKKKEEAAQINPLNDFLKLVEETFCKPKLITYFDSNIWETTQKPLIKRWLEDLRQEFLAFNLFDSLSGLLFERYIVSIINKKDWNLITWRGDKGAFIQGQRAHGENDNHPDLLYEYNSDTPKNGFMKGDRIAIECKWKSEEKFIHKEIKRQKNRIKNNAVKEEEKSYPQKALSDFACCYYLAIGLGWEGEKPYKVYLIPGKKIIQHCNIEECLLTQEPTFERNQALVKDIISEKAAKEEIKKLKDRLKNLKLSLK